MPRRAWLSSTADSRRRRSARCRCRSATTPLLFRSRRLRCSEHAIRSGAAHYQVMTASFNLLGASHDLISGLEGCCSGWAENGGTRFTGFTQLVLPLLTFNGDDGREVMAFRVNSTGETAEPETTQFLSRHKPGSQGGAVVVQMANGRSFVMWADGAPVTGGSVVIRAWRIRRDERRADRQRYRRRNQQHRRTDPDGWRAARQRPPDPDLFAGNRRTTSRVVCCSTAS